MSGGDRSNPYPFTIAETRPILRLPLVEQMMRRRVNIIAHGFDIPYLAGYSKNGSKIYIDRDLAPWSYANHTIDPDRFLKLHEQVEKALIDAVEEAKGHDLMVLLSCLGMETPRDELYFHMHGVATAVELYAVEQAFGAGGVAAYNAFARKQVKRAEDERLRRVPHDLDLTPYSGSNPMDKRLRAAMKKAMN